MRIDLESVLYRIHASVGAADGWGDVLAHVAGLSDGHLATLSRHYLASGRGELMGQYPENARFRSVFAEYAARNPWFLSSEPYGVGRVVTGAELLNNKDLVKTDFYRDLLQPHGLFHSMNGAVIRRGDLLYLISVYRGHEQPHFGEREKSHFRPVLAHMSLAIENVWRSRQADDMISVMRGVVDRHRHPSLLVTAEGRITYRNRSAAAASLSGAGLGVDQDRLVALNTIDRAALREAIRSAALAARDGLDATRPLRLSVPGRRIPGIISVHAAGKAFSADRGEVHELVLVEIKNHRIEHDQRTCSLIAEFRLSPAQARVSVLIVTGHTLAETARMLHVSENTVRSHLKQVFQKTNTHGQMDLVHLHAATCFEDG